MIKKRIQLQTGLFNSRTLEYQVRFSKRSRKSRIKVDLEGIEVVLPEHTHCDYAERMMREYSDWVLRKVALFEEIRKRQQSQNVQSDKILLFHGKPMKVLADPYQSNGKAEKIRIEANRIILPVNGHSKAKAALFLQNHLKEQARLEINSLVMSFSEKMGTPFNRITIRDQRTRWGACSARKSLSFNWRLVMAPPEVTEYVIIHELAHLLEMNHSIRFWKIVEKYCPDYKKRRLWLKKNGHLLRPDFTSVIEITK
ncbi:MAG: M48 family metallopeptidase [Anaerolineaceae bacterium]